MKRISLILVILWHSIVGESQQYYGQSWISGNRGINIEFTNSTIVTKLNPIIISIFSSGNSNICDTSGKLFLSSDGYNIYDSLGNYLSEGDSMVYSELYDNYNRRSPYSQSSIFLPMDSDKYYFITPAYHQGNACYGCHFDIMMYNIINMKANNGAGKVTKKMVHLLDKTLLSRTQMMACSHGNGKDWWLLKQGGDSNIVYKFLFTQDSVYNYGRQVFNAPLFGAGDLQGQSVFNQIGNQYATVVMSIDNPSIISLYDFDRCYGTLSNLEIIKAPPIVFPPDTTKLDQLCTGLAFSPNGRFLYLTYQYDVLQYDLQDKTWFHVAGMDTSYLYFNLYSTLYLAPNNKIYIGNFHGLSKQMSVIDNPDVKGAGCNFCPKCLRVDSLPLSQNLGTPPCMPNYGLGSKVCYPENTEQLAVGSEQLAVYPNPSSTIFYIKNKKGKKKELYNSIGELILSTTKEEINVSRLSSGFYYLKVDNQTKKVMVE